MNVDPHPSNDDQRKDNPAGALMTASIAILIIIAGLDFFSFFLSASSREHLDFSSIVKLVGIGILLSGSIGAFVGVLEAGYHAFFQAVLEKWLKPRWQVIAGAGILSFGLFFLPVAWICNITLLPGKFSLVSLAADGVLALGCFFIFRYVVSTLMHRKKMLIPSLLPSAVLTVSLFWFAIISTHTMAGAGYLVRTVQSDFFLFALGVSSFLMLCYLRVTRLRNSEEFWAHGTSGNTRLTSGLWVVVSFFLFISLFYLDQNFYPSLYQEIHVWLKVLIYFLGEAFFISLLDLWKPLRRILLRLSLGWNGKKSLITSCVLLVLTLGIFAPQGRVESLLMTRGGYISRMISAIRYVLDFDHDGFSLLFGGGDSNDFNSKINPLSREILNNKIDEDGFGGDLTSERMNIFLQTHKDHLIAPEEKPSETKNAANQPPILLITVDTLPAMQLGVYGYHRNNTPNLSRLAKESVLFRRAYAEANNTVLSFYSLFRARYPIHLRHEPIVYRVSEKSLLIPPNQITADQKNKILGTSNIYALDPHPSLAEQLQQAGYRTIAIPNDRYSNYLSKITGARRGFEFNFENRVEDKADRKNRYNDERMTRLAIDYIHRFKNQPFFLWVHYYDHHAFENHPEVAVWGSSPVDKYDSGIAQIDVRIEELIQTLRETGLFEKTIIIFAADHGCSFTPRDETHGTAIDQDQIQIPLLMRLPDFHEGKEISVPAGLIDVMPTLLEYLNLPRPEGIEGWSLMPLITGRKDDFQRYLFLQGWRFDAQQKVILDHFAMIAGDRGIVFDRLNNFYRYFVPLEHGWHYLNPADDRSNYQHQKILREWIEIQEKK